MFSIDEVQRLDGVRMRDAHRVQELVCRLIKGGAHKLQAIVDFDMTLSRFHKNGNRCQTCHGALAMSPLMDKQYQNKIRSLYDHYHPIEIDPQLTMKEKEKFMTEWWKQSHAAFNDSPLNRADLSQIVQESNVLLRHGCDTFLDTLHKRDVPLLILSAGLGDVLLEVLRQQATLHDNVTTVSNFMEFDANGLCTGFKEDTIHCCNKTASAVKNTGYFVRNLNRTNIILMGDSLGDLDMSAGVQDINVLLKIGFLNEKIDEMLPQYLDAYDIVLTDDQTLNVVNALLSIIL